MSGDTRVGETGQGEAQPDADPSSLFTRVQQDPELLAALRDTYRGSHDALDALWWREHPLTVSPSGSPDPAVALAALRRDAYSRGGSEAPLVSTYDGATGRTVLVRANELALREAEQRRELDAAALANAIDDVLRAPAAAPRGAPAPDVTAEEPVLAPRTPRRHLLIAIVAVAVVLVVAISAGVAFTAGRMSSTRATASTPAATSSLGPFSAGQHGAATLALLETSQKPSDVPPFALDSAIDASTVHVLSAVQSPGATVYGAFSKTRLICLIAVTPDLHSGQTCATLRVFVSDGIRLRITTNTPVTTDTGASDFAFYQYFWSSDGSIVGSSNQYRFPASPHF